MIEQYLTLTSDECNTIIDVFNNDDRRSPGKVGKNHIDPSLKASTDINADFNKEEYNQYNTIIHQPLTQAIDQYVNDYPYLKQGDEFGIWSSYNLQHYKDGEGYSKLHCEWMAFHNHYYNFRMMAWMINLNDAQCGTYFPTQDITTIAKQGVCTLWPAYWTHPHKGVTPNIGNKYIATGWVNYVPIKVEDT